MKSQRRSFLAAIAAVVVSSAIQIGAAVDVVRKRWRFTQKITEVSAFNPARMRMMEYLVVLQQHPMGVAQTPKNTFQFSFFAPDRKTAEIVAREEILKRQYELGEPTLAPHEPTPREL